MVVKERKSLISVSLPQSHFEAMEILKEREGGSTAMIIRTALTKYLVEKGLIKLSK